MLIFALMLQKKIAFHTLGCKLNFSETSTLARNMQSVGFQVVDESKFADVYVINTCSVTEQADTKCRNIVRRMMKQNRHAYIVVVGCYAQLKPKEIAEIPGVDLVLGAAEKFKMHEIISDITKNPCGQIQQQEITNANFFVSSYSLGDRTRSFLKIQDGCDYKCSYCTIPLARGKSRSDTMENVLANANTLAANGVKEIVLTGVNTGDFGKHTQERFRFFDLIQELDKIEGIERYRISSIEPNLLTTEIIDFTAKSKKFMPHFHIPLQSGSDKILGLMQRRYKSEVYRKRVEYIKKMIPHAAIGVDVIVGFPGETEQDFLDTFHFLNSLDISYLHVFTYSERPNTKAAEFDGKISSAEKNLRNLQLRNLSEKKKRFFYEQHIGTIRTVLPEEENKGDVMFGFTDNYIKVAMSYQNYVVNNIVPVNLIDLDDNGNMRASISNTEAKAVAV